ncbi:MAG: Histidine phosphotransferase, partial [Belnapia sp.]|nr:Histidine phosphotransferase [Belnapia sp.]
SGAPPETVLSGGPRQLVAPLLLALLAEAGWTAAFGFGGGPGPMPLLLGPIGSLSA